MKLIIRNYKDRGICLNKNLYLLMMMLNKKFIKIILEKASVVHSYNENPTQNFFINYICFFFPVDASICNPFAEPTFERHIPYVKNISLLYQCPLLLKTDLDLY
jgi:hypothetical protein